MECGTLNQNEAVCRVVSAEIDLLPLFSVVAVVERSLLLPRCHWMDFPLNIQEKETPQRFHTNTEHAVKSYSTLILLSYIKSHGTSISPKLHIELYACHIVLFYDLLSEKRQA